VLPNPVKQLALRLDTCADKKGRSFRTAAEEPAFHQLVKSGQGSVPQTHHNNISPGGFPSTKTGQQFL
jgi:hypothetical protein